MKMVMKTGFGSPLLHDIQPSILQAMSENLSNFTVLRIDLAQHISPDGDQLLALCPR